MLTRRAYSLEQEKVEIWRKLGKEKGEEEILTRGCLANIMEKDVWKVQGKEEDVKTSAVEGFARRRRRNMTAADKSVVAQFLRGIFRVVDSTTITNQQSSLASHHHAIIIFLSSIVHE